MRSLGILIALLSLAALTRPDDLRTVIITWSAPNSEGGPASVYDIRYDTIPLAPSRWDQATEVQGEPFPGPPGSDEAMSITFPEWRSYWVGIKSADESNNWSPPSNIAVVVLHSPFDVNGDLEENVVDCVALVGYLWGPWSP